MTLMTFREQTKDLPEDFEIEFTTFIYCRQCCAENPIYGHFYDCVIDIENKKVDLIG